ncbi:hypothetical protein KDA11_00985, partial [Candidatus Saccharibacteria bacterium]|nr:hypothetical protein [Candidatus Saccharibacteria bacterium]
FDGGYFVYDQGVDQEQQSASLQLPEYNVRVINRIHHKDLGETAEASFTQEKVRFSDGAVRLLSRAQPKSRYFGADNISPYAISAGDALFTGPKGVNSELLIALAGLGYHVEWLHHQGRHAVWPTNKQRVATMARFISTKSVGKSAHHDHALLDNLESTGSVDYDTTCLLRDGFSRSAMSGEAFVALAPKYGRQVPYSDLVAKCFAQEYTTAGNIRAIITQAPKELRGIARLAVETASREIAGETRALVNLAGTFDLHPLNIAHEIAWIKPLINGDNGLYSRAIPDDTVGVRGFLSMDDMSQFAEHQLIHADHPNLALIVDHGTHVEGVNRSMINKKVERFKSVMNYMRQNNMSLTGLSPVDFLTTEQAYWIAGQQVLTEAA